MAATVAWLLVAASLPPAAFARELLAGAAEPAAPPPAPCVATTRLGYGRHGDGSSEMGGAACGGASQSSHTKQGISIFTLIWVAAGGLCLVLLVRIVRLRLMPPPAAPSAASGAGGAGPQEREERPSWKVRYGVRVEQPDGGVVAGLEASLRAGLAHTASAVRRTAESFRGATVPTGGSVHAANDMLGVVIAEAAVPTEGVAPPADWAGWRLVAQPVQAPPLLAALHDATAAAAASAAPAPSAPAWPARTGAAGAGAAEEGSATRDVAQTRAA